MKTKTISSRKLDRDGFRRQRRRAVIAGNTRITGPSVGRRPPNSGGLEMLLLVHVDDDGEERIFGTTANRFLVEVIGAINFY